MLELTKQSLKWLEFEMKFSLIALAGLMATTAITTTAQNNAVGAATPGAASIASAAPDAASGLHERNPRYRLRKGDTFDLELAFSPELNQTIAVQPDGYVTLKGIGSIYVEGQTVPELTESLREAYAKTLHDPVITIALKSFEMPYFIAAGQVSKPGKYDLRSDLTVTEAVAIAGGFNDKAKHSQVVLFRPVQTGGYEAKLINIKKLLASRQLSEDIELQPGDMIYVPQSAFSRIRPFLPTSSMGAYLGSGIF
jgi:polysaccharide export outer membrane protein